MKSEHVHTPVSPLHNAGYELFGMESIILAGEDLPNRLPVASGEPRHACRMDVEFSEPADPWHGGPERVIQRIRVVLVARIMGRLMSDPAARTRDGQHYVGTIRCRFISLAHFPE